jgi:hypothetical protein
MKGLKMTLFICLTKKKSYYKVTERCSERKNLGIIEHDGHLNIKPELKNLLDKAHAKNPSTDDFTKATNGATHGEGGTGYKSHHKFSNPSEAMNYLGKWIK